MEQRKPLYEAAADLTIITDSLTPPEVAEKIRDFLGTVKATEKIV